MVSAHCEGVDMPKAKSGDKKKSTPKTNEGRRRSEGQTKVPVSEKVATQGRARGKSRVEM
jgi:hypothetical protein